MYPRRTESISINLLLNKKEADRYSEDIKLILREGRDRKISQHDKLSIDYDFHIDYFGDVAERLEAVNRLVSDSNVLVNCSMEELEHGRSVIRDLFRQIERTIDMQVQREQS